MKLRPNLDKVTYVKVSNEWWEVIPGTVKILTVMVDIVDMPDHAEHYRMITFDVEGLDVPERLHFPISELQGFNTRLGKVAN